MARSTTKQPEKPGYRRVLMVEDKDGNRRIVRTTFNEDTIGPRFLAALTWDVPLEDWKEVDGAVSSKES